jgi:fluoroquinolone resistance protein
MENKYESGKRFEKIDFTEAPFPVGEYEKCTFIHCNFAGANIGGIIFSNVEFSGCNLSNTGLTQTAFRNVTFTECKCLGMQFLDCNPFLFEVTFRDCQLAHSSFYKMKMKKTVFANCKLLQADFTEADLNQAKFENCDLSGATFDRTILERTDFRTSYNFSIDPELNKIRKAKFSKEGILGLLDKYDLEVD